MARSGHRSVLAAIAANLAIAVAEFVVAGITGSSAMLSEAIHSVVDTGDGLLLWIGLRRSRRPPDDQHPFVLMAVSVLLARESRCSSERRWTRAPSPT